jgi:F420-dependent oxidoreductase-like protein
MVGDATAAEAAGFATAWIPQLPQDFDAMTAVALMGRETSRIELGTAVVPLQSRHPIALGQQALSVQAACDGRFRLGVGPSHHWIIDSMLGLPYEQPAKLVESYLDVFDAMFDGPNPVDVENDHFRIHNPLDVTDLPVPVFLAALGPVMLRLAGERAAGTVLWMADERAIAEHVVPRITKAAEAASRPAPRVVAGVAVCLCSASEVDGAITRANDALGHAEYSPNYQRLLEAGESDDVGDMSAIGTEADIERRLRSYRDAGTTDFSARILPLGSTKDEIVASSRRTREFLASLAPELT